MGIGNVLMGDEGIGARVAQFMSKQELPENVSVIDGGTGGLHLLGFLQAQPNVILIDATIDGKSSGTIQRIEPRFSADYPKTLTAHDIGLKDMLDAMYLMGNSPKIVLFAVSIAEMPDVSTDLSAATEKLIPVIAQQIRSEIEASRSRAL